MEFGNLLLCWSIRKSLNIVKVIRASFVVVSACSRNAENAKVDASIKYRDYVAINDINEIRWIIDAMPLWLVD